ncbi:unnamed protein product, partial [Prorocentrum cordatum]
MPPPVPPEVRPWQPHMQQEDPRRLRPELGACVSRRPPCCRGDAGPPEHFTADLEACEGAYVPSVDSLVSLPSAPGSDLGALAHCEELLAGLRSSLRSDLREELHQLRAVHLLPAMASLHDAVQQSLGEAEERLHAALAGRPCGPAPGRLAPAAGPGPP